jgi:hypothetical protein
MVIYVSISVINKLMHCYIHNYMYMYISNDRPHQFNFMFLGSAAFLPKKIKPKSRDDHA